MGLSRQPESLNALRERYPEAMTTVYDMESVALGTALRPGECRANVFDFECGLRLIVSRERKPAAQVVLHLSASASFGTTLYADLCGRRKTTNDFCDLALLRFRELSGFAGLFHFLGFSEEKGVPHWISHRDPGPVTERTQT